MVMQDAPSSPLPEDLAGCHALIDELSSTLAETHSTALNAYRLAIRCAARPGPDESEPRLLGCNQLEPLPPKRSSTLARLGHRRVLWRLLAHIHGLRCFRA